MAKRDDQIDAKIAAAAPFARPILEHLRELVHKAVPEAEEAIKWGMPHFTYKGKNIAGMAAFKAHCSFIIHGEGRQGAEDEQGMGQFGRITSVLDLPPSEELAARLHAARARIDEQGSATAHQRTATVEAGQELVIPDDFTAALKEVSAAQGFWASLTPSQKRDYLEWISEAKREDTRRRRIAQAVEWLADGKRRNWKYDR